MKYVYVPNSYDYTLIDKKYNENEFVELQVKYRNYLEKFINSFIDFNKIDQKIKEIITIPKVEDTNYNFYHKFSSLKSDYIYLRNNYHIENLTDEEVGIIKDNKMDYEFLKNTIPKVVFEDSDFSFFGTPILKYSANSKSLVFEFCYDQLQLTDVKEFKIIDQIIKEITDFLNKNLSDKINIPVSVIAYNGINDLYKNEEVTEEKSLN